MRRFGLIGKTLKHSFSKDYFTKKFAEESISNCSYENFELPSINDILALIDAVPGLEGLNITIPYKEEVVRYLDARNKMVETIAACNCIRIKDKKLYGYNTDAPAFKEALLSKLLPHHKCALILGSGGASKAVQYSLAELHMDYLVVSRHKRDNILGYEDLDAGLISSHQVIINTTPLGMYPNTDQDPPILYDAISSKHLLFDLTYNPPKTKFLKQGEKRGAQILNGYSMLLGQAEESWRIWNEPDQVG